MMHELLILAQDEGGNVLFNLRNGILAALVIVLLVGYKVYKNKTMS